MSLCLGSQIWPGPAFLIPNPESEKSHSSPEDTRSVDKGLSASDIARRPPLTSSLQFSPRDKPKFTVLRHRSGGIFDRDRIVPVRTDSNVGLPARLLNGQRQYDEKATGFTR